MSWFRNTSLSLARQLSRTLDPQHDYEPQACYTSFCKHWQQANDIILKSQGRAANYRKPQHLHDDVLGVVNHLEQLATLLVLEARAREINHLSNPAACLEYLLSENLLDKLYEWAVCTGKYENAVRLEQLRLFGSLISHYSTQVIAAEPFLRPLLKLLSSFRNQLPPPNLESQLVSVLNQLCVVLMQNMKFLDLFFLMTHTQNGSQAEFIIGRLLLSSVHREGATGSAARDALLLCAKMSSRCAPLAHCLLSGNACPVLATGLSGLYSLLPRTIDDNIYRLTPDDVNQVHKLTLFIDSLEFCNAVAQVAHPSIKKHLLDLLYQGFLVPVMGPALLQSGSAEQAASTAYLELILRAATRSGLLRAALHFLLTHRYDGVRLLDVILHRLEGSSQLSLVTLSLMETLIDLNCEDVMIELVYKYLLNGQHLSASYREKLLDPEPYRESAEAFLELSPKCCSRPLEKTREWVEELAMSGRKVLELRRDDERKINGVNGDIAMSNLVHEINFDYGNPNETLYGNYHAYVCDARLELVSRTIACANWTSKYDTVVSPKREANNNSTKEVKEIDPQTAGKEQDSLVSVCTSGYGTLKTSDTSEKEPHSLTSLTEVVEKAEEGKHDSLTSFGESSGYDSLRFRNEENEDSDVYAEESFRKSVVKEPTSSVREDDELPVRTWRVSAETIIGPLLTSLLRKAATLLVSDITMICRVTSILSKLASLPTPLLSSMLLCSSAQLHPNVPSLYQILSSLKEELDELPGGTENMDELVDKARVFLIQREMALVKSRQAADNSYTRHQAPSSPARPDESPFRRMESKRRSISTSFSNMFKTKTQASPPQQSPQVTMPPTPRPTFTEEAYWNRSALRRSVLNAVLFDEWLKELSALCQEHALRLSADTYEDEAYVRNVL